MVDRYFSNIIGAQIITGYRIRNLIPYIVFHHTHVMTQIQFWGVSIMVCVFVSQICLSGHSFKLWVFNLCPFLLCMILLRHVKMNSLRHRHLTFVLSIFLTVLLVWLSPTLPSCMVFILLSSFVFPCPCQWSCSFMIFWMIRFPFIVCNCMILWFWNFPEVVLFIVHDAYKIQWLVC